MVAKKRGIAKKPTEKTAAEQDAFVKRGGVDPEIKQSNIQTSEQSNTQTSKHLPAQTSDQPEQLAKSKNKAYVRSTMYLSKAIHKRLKLAAIDTDSDMSDIAEWAIEAWLDDNLNI